MHIGWYYDGRLDKMRRLDAVTVDLVIDGITYDARDPFKSVFDIEAQYWQEIRAGKDVKLIFDDEHGRKQAYRYNCETRIWEELKKREG